jgi:ABC-2 type transport system ATP-binding protein
MQSVINLKDVKKILGEREALAGVSFNVGKGDIFGYLGPNGAGKTTTIRILLGLLKADYGRVEILGQDINLSETRKKIGFMLDADGLYENMTAMENMIFYARIYGLPNVNKRIEELLGMVNLKERAHDMVNTYSKGMRQRLALSRAMVHEPEVLILDEPTAGIDPTGQIEMRQIMINIARRENKTIFLSSHNLDEVQRICNRIALIDRGNIRIYGELESLRQKVGKSVIEIKIAEPISDSLISEIKKIPEFGLQEKEPGKLIFTPSTETGIPDIINFLSGQGIKIEEAVRKEASLEEIYSTILKEAEAS